MLFVDALLGAKVAVEGGYDACASSNGMSRRTKRSIAVVPPPCDPGYTLCHSPTIFRSPMDILLLK